MGDLFLCGERAGEGGEGGSRISSLPRVKYCGD